MQGSPRRIGRAAALAALAAVSLAACGGGGEKKAAAPTVLDSALIVPDCYTVDPFQAIKINVPESDVSEPMRAFSGVWGGGAWDGKVCHDLYVVRIDEDGGVVMFDAHGPGFFADATAFTRKGVITENGRLQVRKGPARVEYWIENGRMHGTRKVGKRVSRIILTRKG